MLGRPPKPALAVTVRFRQPVVIAAGSHQVVGLAVSGGGNLTWRGGRITAPAGSGWPGLVAGWPTHAVRLDHAADVALEGVHLTHARKAVVVSESRGISLRDSRCDGDVEDCLIADRSHHLRFENNQAGPFRLVATWCHTAGAVRRGLGRQPCAAIGGRWSDGWHADVLQLRNGVSNVVASRNRIITTGQGLTQMDRAGDAPISRVRFENNHIASGHHGLTLQDCRDCRISGNRLVSNLAGVKALIRPGTALACGNIGPDGGPGLEKCP